MAGAFPVSTLLEILRVISNALAELVAHISAFQPFLRFYPAGRRGRSAQGKRPVSTLLEILPLMSGGFLGF